MGRGPHRTLSTGSRRLYSPDAGLTYTAEGGAYSIFYLIDVDQRGSVGLGGKEKIGVGSGGSFWAAIDWKTGKAARRHRYGGGGGGGMLTTREACCLPAMEWATWWRTMRPMGSHCGKRASEGFRMRRRPSCGTAAST
jgi:hypothetical protein